MSILAHFIYLFKYIEFRILYLYHKIIIMEIILSFYEISKDYRGIVYFLKYLLLLTLSQKYILQKKCYVPGIQQIFKNK